MKSILTIILSIMLAISAYGLYKALTEPDLNNHSEITQKTLNDR